MPRHVPLYVKILLLFFLNLALLAVMFWMPFRAQFRNGPEWLLPADARARINVASEAILDEIKREPTTNWNAILKRFEGYYQNKVRFLAFDGRGQQVAGDPVELPGEIRQHVRGPFGPHQRPEGRMEPPGEPHSLMEFPLPGPPGGEARNGPPGPPRGIGPMFMNHTLDPSLYWVIIPDRLMRPDQRHAEPLNLVLVSDTLGAGGLFFEVGPWINMGLAAVAISALLWFPLVRGINRTIAQMTHATRQIAEGRFETRVPEGRRDELGDLGQSINQMAARLAGLVAGQKRFLGDVAHELCSPLAKLRVSLGILDQRAAEEQKNYVARADEEAERIANLVNELLSFSKASLTASAAPLRPVNIREVVDKAVRREMTEGTQVKTEIPENIVASGDPELLTRALSNLLRNAVHYAGTAGPITISAKRESDEVRVTVTDCGPGIPASDLPRIFDPFYRADASRDRETGGVGLGLAIVKTCVESCGGKVSCRNLEPAGLEVTMRLRAEKSG